MRDFMHPDRVVVGAFEPTTPTPSPALYEALDAEIVRCDVNSAEMIKLAANAFLMTRISFINEIANVCEATGADVVEVAKGIGLDHRLGPHFLRAGIGYGGSCLRGEETVGIREGEDMRTTTLARAVRPPRRRRPGARGRPARPTSRCSRGIPRRATRASSRRSRSRAAGSRAS